jgi:hypothetical protein
LVFRTSGYEKRIEQKEAKAAKKTGRQEGQAKQDGRFSIGDGTARETEAVGDSHQTRSSSSSSSAERSSFSYSEEENRGRGRGRVRPGMPVTGSGKTPEHGRDCRGLPAQGQHVPDAVGGREEVFSIRPLLAPAWPEPEFRPTSDRRRRQI